MDDLDGWERKKMNDERWKMEDRLGRIGWDQLSRAGFMR